MEPFDTVIASAADVHGGPIPGGGPWVAGDAPGIVATALPVLFGEEGRA